MHTTDLTKYVHMRWGVDNGGNTVIGPQRPNASVNPSPDTAHGSHSGYFSGQEVRGFSQVHASGTGYGKYGQFLLSPQIGMATGFTEHDSPVAQEEVTCYEYSGLLTRYGIRADFSCTEHANIYRFTYPSSQNASLLVDLAHSVPLLAGIVNNDSHISASKLSLRINLDSEGYVVLRGSGHYEGGFGAGHAMHFYALVKKQPVSYGVYDADGAHEGADSLDKATLRSCEESAGAYLRFTTEENEAIYVKIGISFKSQEKAKQWLESEIPHWDYEAIREETKTVWQRELQKILVEGEHVSEEDKTMVYTTLYHAMCMPRDRSGDLPGYDDHVPMIDDHYAGWDTWRTLYPLYTLIKPEMVTKTVNSFIARHEKTDYVRDTYVAGVDMFPQQGGDDIDNIICDAYVKNVPGIDWAKAYEVVKKHADRYRLGWHLYTEPQADENAPYYRLGYIADDEPLPGDDDRKMACSSTLEHAYNDFCAATMAKALGTKEDQEKYLCQSKSWQNMWNPALRYNEFSGFICPRKADGSWIAIDPSENWGSWVKHFYEATCYNYSFFVPHDVETLIEKCGGEEAFIRRLDHGIETGLIDYGNEPAFLASYLYAYTKQPWHIANATDLLRKKFSLQGPPGNDDSGAMSSWYLFTTLGIFPSAGQNLYFFAAPRYDHAVIYMDNNKEIEIWANHLSAENRYIQSVSINGKRWRKPMFTHDDIRNGAVIVFEMGSSPTDYCLTPDSV